MLAGPPLTVLLSRTAPLAHTPNLTDSAGITVHQDSSSAPDEKDDGPVYPTVDMPAGYTS